MENKKKKRYGIVAALLLLVLAAGVGTYAWLTATQTLNNVFTVGSINIPEKKPDPDQPDKPGTDNNTDKAYLFETKWKDNSKLFLAPAPIRTRTLASRRAQTTPTCSST